MHRGEVRDGAGLATSIVLGGFSAVAGWSVSAGSEIGVGLGLAVATAALVTAARRPTAPGRHEGALVTDNHTGWQEAQRELDRSRRHERPFVLIRIPCSQTGAAGNGHAPGAGRPASLAESLRPFLRSVDCLWTSEEDVYLLLPESRRTMGEGLMSRVRAAEPHLLPGAEQLVSFPEDGVTGGALVALLHGHTVARHSIPFNPDPNRVRGTVKSR
jgi:hypothetical protein